MGAMGLAALVFHGFLHQVHRPHDETNLYIFLELLLVGNKKIVPRKLMNVP